MKSKKPSLYDAQEEQIQLQSASFVDFLTRKGVLEDHNIDNERVRKAKKDTAQRAYHNTEVLLSQYRLIIWVLEFSLSSSPMPPAPICWIAGMSLRATSRYPIPAPPRTSPL